MTRIPREALLDAALDAFNTIGFERTTIAHLRAAAGVSNGSFFHAFPSKESLASALFLKVLDAYHAAMVDGLGPPIAAGEGIGLLIRRHVEWVIRHRSMARFLFEQVRAEWLDGVRSEQARRNRAFGQAIERWRTPLVAAGALDSLPPNVFIGQIIGPAQVLCRAWLSGRTTEDPRAHLTRLIDCALRALLAPPPPTRKGRR